MLQIENDSDAGEFEFNVSAILSGHTQDVKFVKWHPDHNLLFSASYDNTIRCWKYDEAVDDWLCSLSFSGHLSTVWQIDFDSTGQFLCSCSEDKQIIVWTIDGKQIETVQDSHMRSIYSISWQKDKIVTGGADNRICLFKVNEDHKLSLLSQIDEAHSNDINCVQFCPTNPGTLATCADDGQIKIWAIN